MIDLTQELTAFFADHIEANYFDGKASASGGVLTAPIPQVVKDMAEICAQAIADSLEQVGRFMLGDFVEEDSEYGLDWEPIYRLKIEGGKSA